MRAFLRTNKTSGKNEYQFLATACTWPTPWIVSSLVLLFEGKKALHEAESILYYKNYGKWMKDPNEEKK